MVLIDADLDQITSVVLKRLEWDWERVPRALVIPDVIFETKYDVKGIRSQIFALLKYWRDNHSKEKFKQHSMPTLTGCKANQLSIGANTQFLIPRAIYRELRNQAPKIHLM